jgi:hypothetical protein
VLRAFLLHSLSNINPRCISIRCTSFYNRTASFPFIKNIYTQQ